MQIPTVADITTATPVEIDTELYWTELRIAHLMVTITGLRSRLEYLLRISMSAWNHEQAEKTEAQIRSATAELEPLENRAIELGMEFLNRGGWTRAHLVQNSNGHVHRDINCTTCYLRTNYRFLPQVSGFTEAEIVDLAGETACTVCYPDAPVDSLKKASRLQDPEEAAKKAERDAEKAAKAALAAAKAITNPDGTPLREAVENRRDGEFQEGPVVKTERAASNLALQVAFDLGFYCDGHPYSAAWTETLNRCCAALAHKRGVSAELVRAEVDAKTARKLARQN